MRRTTTTIGIVYLVVALATTIAQYLTGALGSAPLALPLAPAPEPVVVTVWTSNSKQDWMQGAAERFASTNPRVGRRPIVVRIELVNSNQQINLLQRQQWSGTPPTAISPTSSEWLARLDRQRAANSQTGSLLAGGASAPRSLALTPLVAVVWADRAAVLWPNGTTRFWQDIHDAVMQPSWQQVAEQHGFGPSSAPYAAAQRWGAVKFVHSSPLATSSGAHTLLMLAYAYHGKASNLTLADVADPDFQTWLGDIESRIPHVSSSGSEFMDDLVRYGPGSADIAIVYENMALSRLEAARRIWGDLRIVYPPSTSFSDNPYAIVAADWTTPEQREGALQFRNFLLSHDEQRQAMLTYGLRPVDPSLSIATPDPQSPFYKYQQFGVQNVIGQQAELPAPEVFDALLDVWQTRFNR